MIMSEADINERLVKHYGVSFEVDSGRKLNKAESEGCVLYSLEGSPPKGYALYILALRQVHFYDGHGRRWRILDDVRGIS